MEIAHHLLSHRGTGRTHDSVMGMKNGLGKKVYVCDNFDHAKQVEREYNVNSISVGQLHHLKGSDFVPVFDHFMLGKYIAYLEEQNQNLHKKNMELEGKLNRINRIVND